VAVGGRPAQRKLDLRTISFTGSTSLSTASPRIRPSRLSTSTAPAWPVSCSTVVSGGLTKLAVAMSSKPAKATSCGTRRPWSLSARMAPIAMRSLAANTASKPTSCMISRRMAS